MSKIDLNTPIGELDISVRLKNCLHANDIKTVKDIVSHQKSDFLKIRDFGKRSLAELECFLSDNGLCLGDEQSEKHEDDIHNVTSERLAQMLDQIARRHVDTDREAILEASRRLRERPKASFKYEQF